ncbi:ArsR/SmtB family transcription factor [Thermostilla marina]
MIDSQTKRRLEARVKVLKALAHPTRLFIVQELSRCEEKCVCELTEMIGADMSTVSRHLALLKNAKLIEDDKRGAQVFYRLRVRCILNFLDCVDSVLQEDLNEQLNTLQT